MEHNHPLFTPKLAEICIYNQRQDRFKNGKINCKARSELDFATHDRSCTSRLLYSAIKKIQLSQIHRFKDENWGSLRELKREIIPFSIL